MAPAGSGTDAAGTDGELAGELTGEAEAGMVATLPPALPAGEPDGSAGGFTPQPAMINNVAAAARPGMSFISDS